MRFVKGLWSALVVVKDGLVLLLLLLFFGLLWSGLKLARSAEAVPGSGALYLALDGPIVEQPKMLDGFSAITSGGPAPEYRLRDVVHALETAAQDGAVKAVVLDLDGFGGGGQVVMERVGAALDKVRAAGKPVLARATLYDDAGYLLAAHASEIWLSPMGMVGVTGPGGSNLYYKGLIDKLGARIHVYRVGTYKSAVEPFIRADQSPEARAASQALVSSIWANWQANVAAARPKAQVADYLANIAARLQANGGDTARTALGAGLVDKLGDEIAFGKHVASLAGAAQGGAPGNFAQIPWRAYLHHHKPGAAGQVGVITVAGEIVDGEAGPGSAGGASIGHLIREALADNSIKALVVRVDSPGGSAAASEDIRTGLLAARAKGLPVIVSMGNVAASGGYWVSTGADMIFAEPSTITGSIGVFGIVPSFETTLAKVGITSDGVKATPLSGEPNLIGGVSPEFDALAQASVDNIYGKFVGLVAQARKLTPQRVDEIGQGRVWDGGTAHQLALVDRFGGLDDAVAEAARRAKLSGAAASARFIDPRLDPLTRLFATLNGSASRSVTAGRAGPRDWLSYGALRQQQLAQRILTDLRDLADGPAIRADCLECRAFTPPPSATSARPSGLFAALAQWVGD